MSAGRPPLILHIIHHLVTGGMENGLVNLINRLPASRYRHAIACIEGYSEFRDRLTARGVDVYSLERSRVGIWRMRRELFRLCRRLQPAILHTRNQSALDALLPARLAGVRHCVHGEHGWDVHDLHGTLIKPALLRRLHAPLIDRYIAVSRDLERYLVRRVGIAPSRITQIYNGVDTLRFAPAPVRPAGVLPEGFAAPDAVIVGTVGRIQPVKDQATLLRAFAAVAKSGSVMAGDMRLAVVGDGPLLGDLRALATSLDIADRTWFPGALDNVPDVMRSFDVFVLPSLNEGISNTILEAMASGLPVIATAAGGNVELVDDDVSGCHFPPGDVAALARLLADYCADPARRLAQGAHGREIAVERFGMETMVAGYLAVYDGFVGAAVKRSFPQVR